MFVLVVGPSGVGKDTLIQGAKTRLAKDEAFWFPERYITRAADVGGEDHIAVDDASFDRLQAFDAFSLTWSAHGLRYALPAEIDDLSLIHI